MTKPESGAQREGFLGDILDKVKDLTTGEEPAPEKVPADVEYTGPVLNPGHPPSHHDSELLTPPPVTGSVD
ncbi:hypothetical protein LFM09_33365 [Lentzea alba]|uniref:hypothetical protein n=1 Tax=Lentzea alba TaxID=2714351 RepID=UPI0039BF3445